MDPQGQGRSRPFQRESFPGPPALNALLWCGQRADHHAQRSGRMAITGPGGLDPR
jgi:hypothetical protein